MDTTILLFTATIIYTIGLLSGVYLRSISCRREMKNNDQNWILAFREFCDIEGWYDDPEIWGPGEIEKKIEAIKNKLHKKIK